MTDRELMQQALEALTAYDGTNGASQRKRVLAALRERLAQPEQEPIAWVYQEGLEALKSGRPWTAYGSNGYSRIPLYLNDAVAPRVEPRASGSGAGFESLPASSQWKGLTDDEIVLICGECAASYADDIRYARAIEAKLRAKNT